jgi:hypothetical protein
MMLCDISVVFNSFAKAFGLMSRKLSSESRQMLVSFQSRKSFGRLQYAGLPIDRLAIDFLKSSTVFCFSSATAAEMGRAMHARSH